MKCKRCGAALVTGANYCFNCGTRVESAQILREQTMQQIHQIRQQTENKNYGAPVWDETPTGTCDCAVGECDCDGSIWNQQGTIIKYFAGKLKGKNNGKAG